MSVTKKFIIIVSAGIILIPVFREYSSVFFILYNVICLALLITDYIISPSCKVFDITRAPSDKLFFKAENTVCFDVRNNYNRALTVTLKDDPKDFFFDYNPNNMTNSVLPNSGVLFSYDTTPTKRGAFLFPNIYVKVKSRLGLCEKYEKRALPTEFKVYPNLKDLSKYRLLMTKNAKLENGKRIINIRGGGSEFESMRDYTKGDDIRKINWNASARAGKHIINLYESEKNQPVFIMIDTGRAMSYTLKGYKKLDYAINAALILSDIVNQKGDNSGLCVFGAGIDRLIKPGKGPQHRNDLMEALYHIEDTNKTPYYHAVFRDFSMRQKRRSLVFLFTDFETDVELNDLIAQIHILKKRHLPVVCLMKNDSVIKMSENTGKTAQAIYERSAAYDYLAARARFIRMLNMSGVACIETDAEDFAIDSVNHYLKIKSRGV